MADLTDRKARFAEKRRELSAVHHALTGVWIGQHEPDDDGNLIISHPKLDEDVLEATISDVRRIPDLTLDDDLAAKVELVRVERDKLRAARAEADVRVVDAGRARPEGQ